MVEKIKKLESITQFNTERGQVTLHPLVTVLDQSLSKKIRPARFVSELYLIFLKDDKCADIRYGRTHYDYQEQSLIFIAPGQAAGFEEQDDLWIQPNGWALAFHPDLIRGTALGKVINDYHFFSYDVKESLHISSKERDLLLESFMKIRYELEHPVDKHSRKLISNNIDLLLNYCERFYDRQFISREHVNKDILVRFETLLDEYFTADLAALNGLPSVAHCADQLNLSAKYFGDLIKKETGRSALDHIHLKLINVAKDKLLDGRSSISEIAYELGFKYPQHFTRLFKQRTGRSPQEYRSLN